MKAHIFLIANLKFCLQTPCSFGDMAENVKLIGIPINDFLCIYIIASSPGLHTSFCLWRVNKKLPQGETSQNTFQRWRSISWKCKIHMVKWAHLPLTEKKNQFCINQNVENNPEWKTFQRHYAVTVSSQVAKTNYNTWYVSIISASFCAGFSKTVYTEAVVMSVSSGISYICKIKRGWIRVFSIHVGHLVRKKAKRT